MVDENKKATKLQDEYELLDTGIFDEDRYFDIVIEYAKEDAEDIVASATITNRGPEEAKLWVLPTVWFRKFWFTGHEPFMPKMTQVNSDCIKAFNPKSGNYFFSFSDHKEIVFCDNETNRERLYGIPNERKSTKDAINDYLLKGDTSRLNSGTGTKVAAIHELSIPAGGQATVQFRMHRHPDQHVQGAMPEILAKRKKEADEFYGELQEKVLDTEHQHIQRQAYAGLLWSKQFYYYDVNRWLEGDPGRYQPPQERKKGRITAGHTSRILTSFPCRTSGSIPGMLPGIWHSTAFLWPVWMRNLPKTNYSSSSTSGTCIPTGRFRPMNGIFRM